MAQEAPGLGSFLSVHGVDTAAASEERKKLQRSVGRLDTAFLMLAAIIVLDMLGAVSSYGAQTFTWLIVMDLFLLPYDLLTAKLGSTFPEEGGSYVWVKLAFGRPAAAAVSVMYWADKPHVAYRDAGDHRYGNVQHVLHHRLTGLQYAFELPSTASGELTNPRKDVPFAILRSGIGTVLFYGVPILAILLVLPW